MPINMIVIINKINLGTFNFDKPIRFKYTTSIGEPQQPKRKQRNHKKIANNPLLNATFKAALLFSLNFKNAKLMNANDKA